MCVVKSPCGSASNNNTFLPSRARATPKLNVVVFFQHLLFDLILLLLCNYSFFLTPFNL